MSLPVRALAGLSLAGSRPVCVNSMVGFYLAFLMRQGTGRGVLVRTVRALVSSRFSVLCPLLILTIVLRELYSLWGTRPGAAGQRPGPGAGCPVSFSGRAGAERPTSPMLARGRRPFPVEKSWPNAVFASCLSAYPLLSRFAFVRVLTDTWRFPTHSAVLTGIMGRLVAVLMCFP